VKKTAAQIKSQITRFSGTVSQELDKPKRRFINEMIYGIQASKDVKLASTARALDEDIPLIKTVGRLSRQIGSKDLIPTIGKRFIEEGKPFIGEDTVLALDLSDISEDDLRKTGISCSSERWLYRQDQRWLAYLGGSRS